MTLAIAEACDLCGGEGFLLVVKMIPTVGEVTVDKEMRCPRCTCMVCGQPTTTPPICAADEIRLDAQFERGQDMAGPDWWAEP